MSRKKVELKIITLMIIVILGWFGFCLYVKYQNRNIVPDDYIAVFNGGSGEVTYSTYIYKIDNGHASYGFKYIILPIRH